MPSNPVWLEWGIVDVSDVKALQPFRYGDSILSPNRVIYKKGSRELVEMTVDAGFLASACRWTADDEDEDVRQSLKSLRGGCAVEVNAFRGGCGYFEASFAMRIELEYAVVRKM